LDEVHESNPVAPPEDYVLLLTLKKFTTAAVLEHPLRRTTVCWDHFKATKQEKMLLLFMRLK
jgi:hypothetical protein